MKKLTKQDEADLEQAYQVYLDGKHEMDIIADKIKCLKALPVPARESVLSPETQRQIKMCSKYAYFLQKKVDAWGNAFYEVPPPSPITIGGLPEKEAIKKKARDEARAKKEREQGGITPKEDWDEGAFREELKDLPTDIWATERGKVGE